MKKQFLDAGKIVNTHGVRGDVKVEPWADSPDFLTKFKTFYIDGAPVKVRSARTAGKFVLISFEDVTDMDGAVRLKNKIIRINRDDAPLPACGYYLADLIGLEALDEKTGEKLGTLTDILYLPGGNVYVITGEREILVPEKGPFVKSVDADAGTLRVELIEGM